MSIQHKLRLIFIALTIAALWQLGLAGWIHIKASLAQVLLDRAWQQALVEGKNVKPWPWADTWPVAELTVPRLGISDIVLAGDSGESLAFGPGHSFASAVPSDDGPVMISGHRDTHFSYLQQLKTGDRLILKTRNAIHYYTVNKTEIVDSQYLKLDSSTNGLILVTCYPFNATVRGGSERFLVHAYRAHKI
jgi:sortase A